MDDCWCLLPSPQTVLDTVAELPYCDAHGCFDVPLVRNGAEDAPALLTATLLTVVLWTLAWWASDSTGSGKSAGGAASSE